jgi:hypothetical protein
MAFAWKVLVPLALANLAVAGIVGRLTFDAYVSAAPGSLQASPIFVLAGFTAANVVLLVVFFTLLSSWRGSREKTALTFERAGVEAA